MTAPAIQALLELELLLVDPPSCPRGALVFVLNGALDGLDAKGVVLIARVVPTADEAGDADETGAGEEDGLDVVANSLYKVFALH